MSRPRTAFVNIDHNEEDYDDDQWFFSTIFVIRPMAIILQYSQIAHSYGSCGEVLVMPFSLSPWKKRYKWVVNGAWQQNWRVSSSWAQPAPCPCWLIAKFSQMYLLLAPGSRNIASGFI
jgi:hypothetical protein